MKNKSLVCVLVVSMGSVAFAQEKKEAKPPIPAPAAAPAAPAAAPPAPQLPPEGKKFLEAFLGNWTAADASFTAGGQKMAGKMTNKCEKASGGWATLCKASFNMKGMPPMANTFLFGWDLATGQGHMFEVSNAGEVHNHSGRWSDDKTIVLTHQGKNVQGVDEKDACTFNFVSAKELKMECVGSQAGATVWTFGGTAKK